MAFSKKIRMRALVDAARHCCVCHRYRGVKVEVHHIVPLERGGTDTADNAIALCFDCHADAGHYNPMHPRGTKFSPEELRMARDLWHLAVRQNQIQTWEGEDQLYCRYLVCKSFTALSEVIGGDLSQVPVESPHLARTAAWEFLASIVQRHPESYRHSHVWGRSYPSRDEYQLAHADVRIFERPSANLYPYFEASRVPSRKELIEEVAGRDSVTAALLEAGVAEKEIAEAFTYDEVCGDAGFQEIFRIRPLWGVFLAATNVASRLIRVRSLTCEAEVPAGLGFRPFSSRQSAGAQELALPGMALPPGATALIPVATVLGPLPEVPMECFRSESRDVPGGEVQQVDHSNGARLEHALALIGPSLWPEALSIRVNGTDARQEIHQLDLTNLYVINRYWEAGCCPHVFLEGADSSLVYYGEIWSREPRVTQISKLVVPESVAFLIVAELEPETAHLSEISVNGKRLVANRVMRRGEYIRIPVRPANTVSLTGAYLPDRNVDGRRPDPWWKNSIVSAFISSRAT